MQRLAALLFWLAAAFALVMASLPQPPSLPGNPGDKLLHIVAFGSLALLAALAFQRLRPLTIFLGLVLFAAMIEAIQMMPAINRDASLNDWLADALAVAVTLIVVAAVRWLARPARLRA